MKIEYLKLNEKKFNVTEYQGVSKKRQRKKLRKPHQSKNISLDFVPKNEKILAKKIFFLPLSLTLL